MLGDGDDEGDGENFHIDNLAQISNIKFSRWTPTLGVCFKWDSQKVLKIAHFGVFRHIGGVRCDRKITDIKI